MIRYLTIITALVAIAVPAAAQPPATAQIQDSDRETHEASGATFPRRWGGQSITAIEDIGNVWNSVLVYSGSDSAVESTTVYIFRAAIPDARLWFERAVLSIGRDIPLDIFDAGPVAPFAALGAAAPNGLYRIYRTDRPGPFRTTAIAVTQAGEWLVKVRLSSASLDEAGMAARIAELGAAIHFPEAAAPAALSAPVAECERPGIDGAGPPAAVNEENLAAASVGGLLVVRRIRRPLAATADDWCRDAAFPVDRGTLLRQVDDPFSWMALFGDAGMAIIAITGREAGIPGDRLSSVYAVTPAFVRLAALFDESAPMMAAFQAAAPVLRGQSEGLIEIGPPGDGSPR